MSIWITRFAPGEMAHGFREETCQDEFELLLSRPFVATGKATLPGFSFGTFRGDHRYKPKFEGGDGIGLDLDGGTDLPPVLAAFSKFAGYVTSTPSSTPTAPRWRVALWLRERVSDAAAYERIVEWAQRLAPGKVDKGTGDASRYWYFGWAGAAHFEHAGLVGEPLDGHRIAREEQEREEREAEARKAARFEPLPAVTGSYAERALQLACHDVATANEGDRHKTLYLKARSLGGYVPLGMLTREQVRAALDAASRGRLGERREAERLRTINDGLDDGIATPRKIARTSW